MKENFIIDMGAGVLTDVLRAELTGYNTRPDGQPRTLTRISRLWVLSETGSQLEEIDLRT